VLRQTETFPGGRRRCCKILTGAPLTLFHRLE